MFGIDNIGLFILSGFLLNILPGPDSLYVIGRGARQGFRAGSVAALGIGSGIMVHVVCAAFGLSAILATSATAFTVVKWIGCAYLLYLGIGMLLSRAAPEQSQAVPVIKRSDSLRRVYYKGFLTNVLNPKVALFFLAFVPQFIASDAPNKALAFLVLGLIFNFNGMLWCHFLAWSASSLSSRFARSAVLARWLNRLAGALFTWFGLSLALSSQR